jgi:hypothetical protein
MLSYLGVYIIYLHHFDEFYRGVNAVSQRIVCFFISIIDFFLDHSWNTKDCSTVESRRIFLSKCINQLNETMNLTDKSLEPNFLYENCSQKLTQLKIVSPAQEYFQ